YPGYISWEKYQENQRRIWNNNNRKDRQGPPRIGSALLSGILFCGKCGRRMSPHYAKKSAKSSNSGAYCCVRHYSVLGVERCQGVIQCDVIDQCVQERLLEALAPA